MITTWIKPLMADSIWINSFLIVLCFASVLALGSQSAASYPSYFLALAMLLTVRRWNDVFEVSLVWWILALLSWLCLSSFWSSPLDLRHALGILGRAILVFLFVVAMAECELRGLVQRWLGRSLAIVGALAAVAAIGVYILDDSATDRLSGLGQLDNPVVLGLVLGATFVFIVEMLTAEDSHLWRTAAVACGLLVGMAILLSGSRNAWFSTLLGVAVLLTCWRIRDAQTLIAVLAAVGVVLSVVVTAVFFDEHWGEWLFPRADSYRLDIWQEVIGKISEHPIIGMGILTPDGVDVGSLRFDHPHSMYLAVTFQGGLVAAALFVLLLFRSIAVLYTNYGHRSARLGLGLLAMALSSYVFDGHEVIDKVGETWFLLWLPIAVALGMSWHHQRGDPEPD